MRNVPGAPRDTGLYAHGSVHFGGGGGSKNQTTTTVQKSDPWAGQQPYLQGIFGAAQNLYDTNNLSFFPGQTFAPQSPETQLAQQAQVNRAISGSPITGAMQGELTKTLGGDYLSAGNPHFAQMADSIRAQVMPQIDSSFVGAGRTGSGLHGRAIGEGLGSAIGNLAYQNFGDERNRQMQSMLFAPQAAQADYFDIAKLAEAGAAKEDFAQQGINEQIARHDFNQMAPWNKLGLLNQMVQGNYGGTSTGTSTTQLPRQSVGAGMLGGGLTGFGLGNMIMPGIGGLIGGGLGLLGGLF